jgi:hypothetical protein
LTYDINVAIRASTKELIMTDSEYSEYIVIYDEYINGGFIHEEAISMALEEMKYLRDTKQKLGYNA